MKKSRIHVETMSKWLELETLAGFTGKADKHYTIFGIKHLRL
jgi:hypothetical protein